jgi:hypothetical protein
MRVLFTETELRRLLEQEDGQFLEFKYRMGRDSEEE